MSNSRLKPMNDIIKRFRLEFNFAVKGTLNSSISQYLATSDTEKTDRPIYYCVKDVNLWERRWTAIYLSLFFDVNPGYCFGFGKHNADVEKIILLMSTDSFKPEWVYFSAHGNGQGTWVKWNDCLFTEDKALRVFVSPSSNGNYPKPGCYWRIGGFANDHCYDHQVTWRPSEQDFCDASMQSWTRSHYQVAKGINTPAHPDPPPSTSASSVDRFFLCIPKIKKKIDTCSRGVFV